MPGDWDIAGSFLQGMMARQQHEQMKEQLKQDMDYKKAQMKLLELQGEQALKKSQMAQSLFAPYLASLQGQPAPQFSNETQPQAGAPQAGTPQEGLTQMIAKAQTDPVFKSLLKSELGVDVGSLHPVKGLAGPDGTPITQFFSETGQPFGQQFPEPVENVYRESVDPRTGMKGTMTLPKYTGAGGGGFIPTGPAETDTQTVMINGIPYQQDLNKVTRQPIGPPRASGQGSSSNSIYQSNIKNLAIPAAQNLAKNLFTLGDDNQLHLTVNARVQGTFPMIAQKLGGEIANDAVKLATALLRPDSGAAIGVQELTDKINAQLPKLGTGDKYAKEQFLQIGNVIDDYLKGIDPQYVPQARKLMEEALPKPKGKMTTPPKLGGKKDDPLGLR